MSTNSISRARTIIVRVLAILLAAILAILVHAALPQTVNVEQFDSALVKLFGFPVVATFYFVLLFTHCAVMISLFGAKANIRNSQIGIRFGISFAVIYLAGMQEVVVEASPFSTWGLDFVKYQLVMGVGDAIPVLLLCLFVALFALDRKDRPVSVLEYKNHNGIKVVAVIAISFLIERAIGYKTGMISSNCDTYPIQTYAWTLLFGMALGYVYLMLYPIFASISRTVFINFKISVLTIGINWIIFNSFIGLIFNGALAQTLLRSGVDVVVLLLATIITNKYLHTGLRRRNDLNSSLH